MSSATLSCEQILSTRFGFSAFRSGQREVIDALLCGDSALALFPTGAGKSLCYQLPALMMEGMTLVVSPLIALMKDQIDFLQAKGIRAARMDSSLSGEETRSVWEALRQGELKLLYVAPERFGNERFLQRLRKLRLSLMVIDEAHCISEWGHNFRPDYMKLSRIASDLKVERVLALTATATPSVVEDICRSFNIPERARVITGFHRPNLELASRICSESEQEQALIRCLQEEPRGASIVYVTLQKQAESLAQRLQQAGMAAEAYHAGLKAEQRHEVQDRFMQAADRVVVATIAFGMGIDKTDIRKVIHVSPPKSLENYMQETGRAGRDGKRSSCVMLFNPEDVSTLENFSYGDTPTQEALTQLLGALWAQPDEFDLSQYELSQAHDIRPLVLNTLLCYLELQDILQSKGPRYTEYAFQFIRSQEELLSRFDEERASFLRRLFAQARRGRSWYNVNLEHAAQALGEERQRMINALNYLEECGELRLKVSGLRHQYRFLQRPQDPAQLAQDLYRRFVDSEQRDIARIHQVIDLATGPECLVRKLLAYFGEKLEADCGHCDRCQGHFRPRPELARRRQIPDSAPQMIRALKSEQHSALSSARQRARFLCGIPSPASSRARLTRDPRFGSLARYPFSEILQASQ